MTAHQDDMTDRGEHRHLRPTPKRPFKLYQFSATLAGDFWQVSRGHAVTINGEEFVVTGWDFAKCEVYVSRDTQHRVIKGNGAIWETCSMQFRGKA